MVRSETSSSVASLRAGVRPRVCKYINKAKGVRIVRLQPFRAVCASGFGTNPEAEAWSKLKLWVQSQGMLHELAKHRFFGFNNPNPSVGSPNYGYDQQNKFNSFNSPSVVFSEIAPSLRQMAWQIPIEVPVGRTGKGVLKACLPNKFTWCQERV